MALKYPLEIIYSNRRSLALQVTREGHVVARAPWRLSESVIRRFAESKATWIERQMARNEIADDAPQFFTTDEMKTMMEQARILIPERVAHYAPLVGVNVGRITLRFQHTRWGSCSSVGNLNFNAVLAAAELDLLDYVVVHELCHRLQMNHSPLFWAEVARVCPDWHSRRDRLKRCGLLARIPRM